MHKNTDSQSQPLFCLAWLWRWVSGSPPWDQVPTTVDFQGQCSFVILTCVQCHVHCVVIAWCRLWTFLIISLNNCSTLQWVKKLLVSGKYSSESVQFLQSIYIYIHTIYIALYCNSLAWSYNGKEIDTNLSSGVQWPTKSKKRQKWDFLLRTSCHQSTRIQFWG